LSAKLTLPFKTPRKEAEITFFDHAGFGISAFFTEWPLTARPSVKKKLF